MNSSATEPVAPAAGNTTVIAYISIGNSDDRLTQRRWAEYTVDLSSTVRAFAEEIHGEWFSSSDSPYQNMCICAELRPQDIDDLQRELIRLRTLFEQDSIAWAETPRTVFL